MDEWLTMVQRAVVTEAGRSVLASAENSSAAGAFPLTELCWR